MVADAIMLGMRGPALGKVMQKLRTQIKILFMSDYNDHTQFISALAVGI